MKIIFTRKRLALPFQYPNRNHIFLSLCYGSQCDHNGELISTKCTSTYLQRRQRDQVQYNEMAYQFMIFYQMFGNLQVTKNCVFCWSADHKKRKLYFSITKPYTDVNLKLWILIKRGFYIVPSPSTTLIPTKLCVFLFGFIKSK